MALLSARHGVVIAVLAVACGCTAGVAAPADRPSAATARPTELQDAVIANYGLGLRTYPAPAGSSPRIDAATALAGDDADSIARGTSEPPQIGLRLVSTGYGDQATPKRLAWVLVFHGTAPVRSGPPPGAGLPTGVCDTVVVLDANSGSATGTYQICPGT